MALGAPRPNRAAKRTPPGVQGRAGPRQGRPPLRGGPKERFVSYPGASPDGDPSLLLGWAGWNHRDQAEALVNLVNDRSEVDGWDTADPRCVPLLAGLLEIMPWVHQWHDEYDEEWGDNPAQEFQTGLHRACAERRLSESDLRDWRPEKKRGGRKAALE
ncbi:DUF7008 domain-containing protein [Streptomyces sp. NPDC090022]|uniref:DUF7008 domain-containing protein n=1 Tax=Streptomyces sp. NPDC090022 TaxID=3365920 RepID=UPI00380E4BA5